MPSPGAERGRPSTAVYHPHFCPGWKVVVHLCTLRPGCRPRGWKEEVGEEETRRVFQRVALSRNCRSLVWCIGEESGVSEDMVPFIVFGYEATVPWVGGASRSHQASPTGPLHPVPPFLGFLTAGSVSTCDWLVSLWFLLIRFPCCEGVVFSLPPLNFSDTASRGLWPKPRLPNVSTK